MKSFNEHKAAVMSVQWNPHDGHYFVSSGDDGTAIVWNIMLNVSKSCTTLASIAMLLVTACWLSGFWDLPDTMFASHMRNLSEETLPHRQSIHYSMSLRVWKNKPTTKIVQAQQRNCLTQK